MVILIRVNEVNSLKNILMIMRFIFATLTFVGAGYVLFTGGEANAGYAVIPMLLTLIINIAFKKQP